MKDEKKATTPQETTRETITTATISVIVPAAGCGARAALNGNKVLAPLLGKPLLWHTLRALAAQIEFTASGVTSSTRCARIIEVLIAVRENERAMVEKIYVDAEIALPLRLVEGGATRADSVRYCVDIARGELVLVHDAARPCLSSDVTSRVVAQVLQSGAAIAALPADDTVKRVNGEKIAETLERSTIYLAQTPQGFRREWLRDALHSAQQSGFCGTDCASYVERWLQTRAQSSPPLSTTLVTSNGKENTSRDVCVKVVCGDARNLKVTYAEDLERAAHWLDKPVA